MKTMKEMKELLKNLRAEFPNEYDENSCDICDIHDIAFNIIPGELLCPNCYYNLIDEDNVFEIVGETNHIDYDDEHIKKSIISECPKCKQYLELCYKPIIYNGNHDIYYTGGKDYINTVEAETYEDLRGKIYLKLLALLEQYKNNELENFQIKLRLNYIFDEIAAGILDKLKKNMSRIYENLQVTANNKGE